MDYKKFCELIANGENQTVDYKIECNAFIKGNEKDTAELIKDIIAFSNNGYVTNFLIIGVANDRKSFKNVENTKLTDDNLQSLIRENIFPVPRVKLFLVHWDKVNDLDCCGKIFCIIQIGPHARQCFRLMKNYIDYEKRYCFKKNEVWIRRQATSDLALPEEIARLLIGKKAIEEEPNENVVYYNRLSRYDFSEAVIKDLKEYMPIIKLKLVQKKKSQIPERHDLAVDMDFFDMKLRLAIIIVDRIVEKGAVTKLCRTIASFHHGSIIISIGNVSRSSLDWCYLKVKESWGHFVMFVHDKFGQLVQYNPKSKLSVYQMNQTFSIVLDNVSDTSSLQKKISSAIADIVLKTDFKKYITEVIQQPHQEVKN